MKTTIFTDGFEGWAKRGRARAKALDAGIRLTPSREITFESAAEMARLLTPARLELFERVKQGPLAVRELAASLSRDVRAVSRDVNALEKYKLVRSKRVVNPGHGQVRVVSAPSAIVISAKL